MTTGSSADLLSRVKRLIPHFWFSFVAPYRDAVIGGLSDLAASCYGLIVYAQLQARIATATGLFLDITAFDFLGRYLVRSGNNDSVFRAKIKATILKERVTRLGMVNAITQLVGNAPKIFEPWNTNDAGAYGIGPVGYGVAGGWGNMGLPGQVFIAVQRPPNAGIPNAGGYGNYPGGYGTPSNIEYGGPQIEQSGITNQDIYDVITATKPTGVIVWTIITDEPLAALYTPPPH